MEKRGGPQRASLALRPRLALDEEQIRNGIHIERRITVPWACTGWAYLMIVDDDENGQPFHRETPADAFAAAVIWMSENFERLPDEAQDEIAALVVEAHDRRVAWEKAGKPGLPEPAPDDDAPYGDIST